MTDEKDDLRKRTKRFALRVIKVCQALPGSGSAQVLGHQLLRAGTSVGANFQEPTSQLIAILTSIAKKVRARL